MRKSIFIAMMKKESLHILRDPRTMAITLLIPVMLLLLFSFAISTEVNLVRVSVVSLHPTDATRASIERLRENPYFDFLGMSTPEEAETLLRSGKTDAVVFLRSDGKVVDTQIMVDASNTFVAQSASLYIRRALDGDTEMPVNLMTLYNPQLKSAYNFVPGIMGMIFILICSLMTSISIVSEKENGTMNLLLVSPIRTSTIIFGKLLPYFALSCVILAVMLSLAYTVIGLPASSNILNVVWITMLYVILSLAIGLFVSTVSSNQMSAMIVSGVLFMLPILMFSGMIFPIDNMPAWLQWFSCAIPARWYISAMRKLMIQQLGLEYVWLETGILAGMTVFILSFAISKFKSKSK